MGRSSMQKYEHGTFITEWVDEVPPLGEDRETVMAPEIPFGRAVSQLEEVVSQARADMIGLMSIVMNALKERYGDEIWEIAGKALYDIGYQRGKEVAQTMKIDPEDARSVGRIFDFEDSSTGIKGEWVESGKKRAVKREYFCPLSPTLALCPDICTRLFDALERGTFDAIGVRVKDFHFEKLLPKGDPYCEVVLELED